MKNSFKLLMTSLIVLALTVVGSIFIEGYNNYKKVLNNISLDEKITEIKSDKDYTSINNINEDFLDAIVSVEDHRFYKHHGLDFISITRATINNVANGKIVQGGSTISQQLAKNLYLNGDKNFSRKVTEALLAKDIEEKYTKDQILEMYVNIINYGDNYIGIKEASKGYFNIEPKDLDLNEASLLAGLPQCPNGYALSNNYDRAIMRQKQVLEAMNISDNSKYDNEYYVLGDIYYKI